MTRCGFYVQEVVAGSAAQRLLEQNGYELYRSHQVRGFTIAVMRRKKERKRDVSL